ncbi:PREDICTED: cyclic nucleotide-gated ion channel 1-like [Nicotiana attenuata]|uniref:Cyclic nucleotide-gated ion channel 1 n=1 Tax=Nicotiana attenuata TaxID=49451 RepID=A0A314LCU5_NICAT|nr:PREDICTED: cyclic nucleotide-gated ion channel 1-like [Nicotiana attenuata]OIT38534.1 cyclic nucleotide-gated ion channel 1 [Nicotiana attenuata]
MMNLKQDKYVRFEDWQSEQSSFNSEHQNSPNNRPFHIRKPSFSLLMSNIRRRFESGSERISSWRKSIRVHPLTDKPTKDQSISSKKQILDPQGRFLQQWNKIFVLICTIAVSLDPLFFYIPVIDNKNKCLDLDTTLKITACVLRSSTDLFYIFHIVLQFRTGFIAPSSRVFGRGELIEDSSAIAKRYLKSYFIVDILAVLPLPQIVILIISPSVNSPISLATKEILKIVIFVQYVPRIFRIYPLYKEVTRTAGLFTETAWGGAAFNLFLYMLASNVVGAFWYLISVERQDTCWRDACKKIESCSSDYLYCGGNRNGNALLLNSSCPLLKSEDIKDPNDFDFGIFLDALQFRIVEKQKFWSKLFYCFWWGLRNLSSLGQNLKTSTFVGEILFAIFISIIGLILFSLLIGNMQKYLQSITVRVEEMRVRRRDAEQWMSHRMLPDNLRARIRRHEQYKWQETRGVEEDLLIHNLPRDLRRDLKRHLCWSLVKRVPMFEKMDEQLLDAMCDRLKPALYTEKSFIIREGDPVDEMLFLMRGTLLTMTTNGGRTGFFNSVSLKAGDFCGEELLTWALDPHTSSSLPISTRTVQAETDIEAFALTADDLKFVASQFRRLHSKQLQHSFRFYSQQWRTWGACFIQVAWRRHCRNKLEKSLREEEDRLQAALAKESTNAPSLGATIYASRFAANALRALRRNHTTGAKLSPTLPLLLQKPAEPNFSEEKHS